MSCDQAIYRRKRLNGYRPYVPRRPDDDLPLGGSRATGAKLSLVPVSHEQRPADTASGRHLARVS